jgi:Flp pilus assembly protein TadB
MTNVTQGPWSVDSDPGSSIADAPEPAYDGPMNAPTREEFNARIEAVEARMDGRVTAIQASIEGFMGRMEERLLRTDDRFARIENSQRETQASLGSLKTTIIVTAVSTVLAIVLGVAAFNATVLSNMVASFESGKEMSAAQAEVKRQTEETAALLKQMQQQLSPAPKAPAAAAPSAAR